eukprot:137132-Amphidinium_carterae.1
MSHSYVILGTHPENARYSSSKYLRWCPPEWLSERTGAVADASPGLGSTPCVGCAVLAIQPGAT